MLTSLNFPYRIAQVWLQEIQKSEKIQIISKTTQVVVKRF